MKILLTALNSKYMHTSLSIRSLRAYLCKNGVRAGFLEFTINDPLESVCDALYLKNADVYCFSVYIWNLEQTLALAERLKLLRPDATIILGGPEVSFTPEEILQKRRFIDFIVCGEGEKPLLLLLRTLENGEDVSRIPSVALRADTGIVINPPPSCGVSLEEIPFAYTGADLRQNAHKLLYYESSRGCPYACGYCISSAGTIGPVKFLPLSRVFSDLRMFFRHQVFTVKFVDRTFNADRKRAIAILDFCNRHAGHTKIHVEIYPDLIDDAFLACCKSLRAGIFQFEIGIQTLNPKTLRAIGRKNNGDSFENLQKLLSFSNIEVHLDLIALLPHETLASFQKTFERVYVLRPQVLHLGFLKLLKGTKMRAQAADYGFVYQDKPPYEVFASSAMPYDKVRRIKQAEYALDKFYNHGGFFHSLGYCASFFKAFDFYAGLAGTMEQRYTRMVNLDEHARSEVLYRFVQKHAPGDFDFSRFSECLKLDYFCKFGNKKRLGFLEYAQNQVEKDDCQAFFEHPEALQKYLPQLDEYRRLHWIKYFHFAKFNLEEPAVYLYDLTTRQAQAVTKFFYC